jgi:nucleotide-binding universal stress UspA family protein
MEYDSGIRRVEESMKIVLAADGSKYTRRAVNYLIAHLADFGSHPEIHLLYVQQPVPGRAAAAVSVTVLQRYYQEESRKALAVAGRMLNRMGIRYEEVHRVGDPGSTIAAYAERRKFSLIIMGSHGRGAISSFVLGSVVRKVLASCSVPVLIVR